MSELRQRRGERHEDARRSNESSGFEGKSEQEKIDALEEMLMSMKKNTPLPGLSNAAKKKKDALAEDPYNMQCIFELGEAYANDEKWNECANVMMRGWKRANELESADARFDFLVLLCQASYSCSKYRQALAVLNSLDDIPEEIDEDGRFTALKTQIYCMNGDTQRGLKAFHAMIKDKEFNTAAALWASCNACLKKAGIFEVTKLTLRDLAVDDESKAKLDAMEKIAEMKELLSNGGEDSKRQKMLQVWGIGGIILVFLFALCYVLYLLEQRSLESWNMKRR